MSSSWFVPALGFMLAVGASGITLKLSLRDVSWQVLNNGKHGVLRDPFAGAHRPRWD